MMESEKRTGITVQADTRWALINQGIVENVILWDGNTETFDPVMLAVQLAPASRVGPGWTHDGSDFHEPTLDPEEPQLDL